MNVREEIKTVRGKIAALEEANQKILSQYPEELKAFFGWIKLSYSQQEEAKKQWDEYYRQVSESPLHDLFMEQKKAFKSSNNVRIKELAAQAKQMRLNKDFVISSPTAINPYLVQNDEAILCYKENKKKIDFYEQQLDILFKSSLDMP